MTDTTKAYFELCDSIYDTWKTQAQTYLANSKI